MDNITVEKSSTKWSKFFIKKDGRIVGDLSQAGLYYFSSDVTDEEQQYAMNLIEYPYLDREG